jgi:hypothetical protein
MALQSWSASPIACARTVTLVSRLGSSVALNSAFKQAGRSMNA